MQTYLELLGTGVALSGFVLVALRVLVGFVADRSPPGQGANEDPSALVNYIGPDPTLPPAYLFVVRRDEWKTGDQT